MLFRYSSYQVNHSKIGGYMEISIERVEHEIQQLIKHAESSERSNTEWIDGYFLGREFALDSLDLISNERRDELHRQLKQIKH
jgi:hypothetical protein